MKIQSSQVQLAAEYTSSTRQETSTSTHAWIGKLRPDMEAVSLSTGNINKTTAGQAKPPPSTTTGSAPADALIGALNDNGGSNDPKIYLLKLLVEMFVGHKIKLISISDMTPASSSQGSPNIVGVGTETDQTTTLQQTDQQQFQGSGVIKTNDGQSIDFNLQLSMQDAVSTQTTTVLSVNNGARKDPLVINFNGSAAQLQDQKFSFDINGDGKKAQLSLLGPNSGFLALDKNGDGKIDSGKELFGASSGNGFADLAKYDTDGNGWIDENDPIFKQLMVWKPDAEGKGTLIPLADLGVGAIYLGQAATSMNLHDQSGKLLGDIRASGIYLSNSGQAGTVQQIDLMA